MQRSAIADTICRTIELGVTITDAALDGEDRTHLFCEVYRCGRGDYLDILGAGVEIHTIGP